MKIPNHSFAIKAEWKNISAYDLRHPKEKEVHSITINGVWSEEDVFWVYYEEEEKSAWAELLEEDERDFIDEFNPMVFCLCKKLQIIEKKYQKYSHINTYTMLSVEVLKVVSFTEILRMPPKSPIFADYSLFFLDRESYYDIVDGLLYIGYYSQGPCLEFCIKINEKTITIIYECEISSYYRTPSYCSIKNYETKLSENIKNWWINKGLIGIKANKMYLK